eukprot:350874-Chlamydomonas_euryale.AAC.15
MSTCPRLFSAPHLRKRSSAAPSDSGAEAAAAFSKRILLSRVYALQARVTLWLVKAAWSRRAAMFGAATCLASLPSDELGNGDYPVGCPFNVHTAAVITPGLASPKHAGVKCEA